MKANPSGMNLLGWMIQEDRSVNLTLAISLLLLQLGGLRLAMFHENQQDLFQKTKSTNTATTKNIPKMRCIDRT